MSQWGDKNIRNSVVVLGRVVWDFPVSRQTAIGLAAVVSLLQNEAQKAAPSLHWAALPCFLHLPPQGFNGCHGSRLG